MASVYSSRLEKRKQWWKTQLREAEANGRGDSTSQRTNGKGLISGLDILQVRIQAERALRKAQKCQNERSL
ncbi:MAG: hypothetical protein EXS51_01375 [Candidatus Taylorbacteria bacterium]|nr:hypothetical protein [Candidatus Taylorbacteria bacterium]